MLGLNQRFKLRVGDCAWFLGKTPYPYSVSLHPRVGMGTGKLSGRHREIWWGRGGNPLVVTPSCYMVLILPFCCAYKFFTCLTTALTLTPGEEPHAVTLSSEVSQFFDISLSSIYTVQCHLFTMRKTGLSENTL